MFFIKKKSQHSITRSPDLTQKNPSILPIGSPSPTSAPCPRSPAQPRPGGWPPGTTRRRPGARRPGTSRAWPESAQNMELVQWEKHGRISGNMMGKYGKNHGRIMGKIWKNIGNIWEKHGRIMGKIWKMTLSGGFGGTIIKLSSLFSSHGCFPEGISPFG